MTHFKSIIAAIACILSITSSFAQSIRYELRMENPANHYFQVDMYLTDHKKSDVVVKMPVWAPGSYLVREFSKNVNLVRAYDENGRELEVTKKTKNAWSIAKGKAKTVKVSYEVYAFELSVRTSFLDMTHGFVSGTGIFMYTEDAKNNPGKLKVTPHASFKKIATSLDEEGEGIVSDAGIKNYTFPNYDHLVDCPIEIGNHEEFTFTAVGIPHTVAMYGWGNYDVEKLKVDMAKIVEATTDIFKQNPNKKYTFIIHNVTDGQGGLEHINSTTLSVNRYTYQGDEYLGFLSLVAHEYFHLWNVKRIRAFELGPFNYDEEAYTSLLWVMEGFTSYYDELILLRAGFYTDHMYMNKLFGTINYVEGSVGARVQPVAHASFDAWIKSYRPNENSANTQMSYYSRGGVIAALLDAMIIKKYNGEKCLDHFLQHLYAKYFEKLKRGFTEKEFQDEVSSFLQTDMTQFFKDYISGTKIPDYEKIFGDVGIVVRDISTEQVTFGANLLQNGKTLSIRTIRAGSSAEMAGLSPNDEIIGLNGMRVNQSDLEKVIAVMKSGESFNLLISRDNVLLEIKVVMSTETRPKFSRLYEMDDNEKIRLRDYMLRRVL